MLYSASMDTKTNKHKGEALLGWREWVALPDLGLPAIKAKVDTGAKTSALHAFDINKFQRDGKDWVGFSMHPLQKNNDLVVQCESLLIDEREVTDSGGHKENRLVIQTTLLFNNDEWPIEMTLTNRDNMLFRMLLGRRALTDTRHSKSLLVDPSKSYLCGKLDYHSLY